MKEKKTLYYVKNEYLNLIMNFYIKYNLILYIYVIK